MGANINDAAWFESTGTYIFEKQIQHANWPGYRTRIVAMKSARAADCISKSTQ